MKRKEPVLWYQEKEVVDGKLLEISTHECRFWQDFIRKYLLPLQSKLDDQLQIKASLEKLRNRLAILYILSNMCFITLILSLEYSSVSNKKLSFEMPCYISGSHVARIRPLSIVFVIVFGVLLVCQLVAMLFHRISTFLHIIASIDLSFILPFNRTVQLSSVQLAKDMQSLDKDVVDPDSLLTSSVDDDDDDDDEEKVFYAGRSKSCHDVMARKRQPVWASRVDNTWQEPGSLRGRFHENFKNITGRRYNKSESEQLLRKRQLAGFHVNSLPALAAIVNNSEFVRKRWERATRRVIAEYRFRKRRKAHSQPKLLGVVNRLMSVSYPATTEFLGSKRDGKENTETPNLADHKDVQATRFIFITGNNSSSSTGTNV